MSSSSRDRMLSSGSTGDPALFVGAAADASLPRAAPLRNAVSWKPWYWKNANASRLSLVTVRVILLFPRAMAYLNTRAIRMLPMPWRLWEASNETMWSRSG